MSALTTCVFCQHKLYHLNDGMVKCPSCRKKYSLQKLQTDLAVIEAFCDTKNAKSASADLDLNYTTVKKRFDLLRLLITEHLEERYQSRACDVREYEEYLYLEATKRNDRRHIFDAHNFLTFDYGGWIYTLMMPSLHRHKMQFLEDRLEENYYQEFSKFLRLNRISKLQNRDNLITRFWDFFEHFITRFRGVHPDHFAYYLKEAEFKFNYPATQQREVLKTLWLNTKH